MFTPVPIHALPGTDGAASQPIVRAQAAPLTHGTPFVDSDVQNARRAAPVPRAAGRHPRRVPTARTIVNASTTSTSEARKAEPMAGAATLQDAGSIASLPKI